MEMACQVKAIFESGYFFDFECHLAPTSYQSVDIQSLICYQPFNFFIMLKSNKSTVAIKVN